MADRPGGSGGNGFEAAAHEIPDPTVAAEGSSGPGEPGGRVNQETSAEGEQPDTDTDGEAQSDADSGSGSGTFTKPETALGWLGFPFVVFWRLLFPKKPRPFIVELPFLVVFALFLAFLIKTFLVQAFYIPSGSMQNTLAIGDRVLVNRASVWLGGQPQRGQVVVFQDPGGWLGPSETTGSSNWLTKALTFVGVL